MGKFINYYNILHIISVGLLFESVLMLTILPFAAYESIDIFNHEALACLATGIIGLSLFIAAKKRQSVVSRRESFYIAFFLWIAMSTLGALPYFFTGYIPVWYDAIFESVSGFSTTGSSILNDIEALPKSLLFWRALTHWIGGLGILVLVVALIPFMQSSGNNLVFTEGNFIETERIKPRMIQVAKRLWFIYIVLTASETLLLYIEGLDLFDSVCHSFATVATGGFSTKNSSAAEMSPAIQNTLSLFMILSGMNFVLHFHIGIGNFKKVFRNTELRYYLGLILFASLYISALECDELSNLPHTLRHAVFQVSSIITATGFASYDYELWAPGSKAIIVLLMLTGACVGSTGGGIKVKRHIIALKAIKQHMYKLAHPRVVNRVRYGDLYVKESDLYNASSFIAIYFVTLIVGTFFMMSTGIDFKTSASSIATTLAGIGPGFGDIGPTENFQMLPAVSKLYLCFNMVLGRIEIIPVLVLFHPAIRKP